ncbi:MAG: hypothetical protein GDA45_00575 [Chromatiales bacterium]|nr:hypothetical protein [Chromatiales bacterium]
MGDLVFDWYWVLVPIALLPVAAVSGWRACSQRNILKRAIAPEYIKGLNYLLDQQTDKAVEIFIKFFQVDMTTLETHVLLGNLFRRKGELEKAIRIHGNLIQRDHLNDNAKSEALFELGQDYLHAGLLSNAEDIFKRLIKTGNPAFLKRGYNCLITIYEMEKSWHQAIACAQQLQKLGNDCSRYIVHYYCELAEKELADCDNYDKAQKYLAKAKALESPSVRLMIIQGDLALARLDRDKALAYYSQAFSDYPGYADILLPKLKKCFSPYDPKAYATYVKNLNIKDMTVLYIVNYIQSMFEANRIDEAEEFLFYLIETKRAPLRVLKIFIEEKLKGTDLFEDKIVRRIIDEMNASLSSDYFYMCSKCGFKAYQLYWQCPSCHTWDSSNSIDIVSTSQPQTQ